MVRCNSVTERACDSHDVRARFRTKRNVWISLMHSVYHGSLTFGELCPWRAPEHWIWPTNWAGLTIYESNLVKMNHLRWCVGFSRVFWFLVLGYLNSLASPFSVFIISFGEKTKFRTFSEQSLTQTLTGLSHMFELHLKVASMKRFYCEAVPVFRCTSLRFKGLRTKIIRARNYT